MTCFLISMAVLCLGLVFLFWDIRLRTPTPVVYTSRNQTVINNGELIVTSVDAGSVSVRSTEDTIIVTYTRRR